MSLQYLVHETIQGFNAPELYAQWKEAYEIVKGAVVGGPSLAFTRKYEGGKTAIRSREYENARTCQRMLDYDANTLKPSTMLQEMSCGPGKVVHYEHPAEDGDRLVSRLREKMWFGFAQVDIRDL